MDKLKKQLYILEKYSINNLKFKTPYTTNFIKFEKDETILTYWLYQNWQNDNFKYHTGMDGYRGLSPIFDFNLNTDFLSKIRNTYDNPNEKNVSNFIKELFNKLKPFDDQIIKISQEISQNGEITKYSVNIPENVLILKFLREILCNPFGIIYLGNKNSGSGYIEGIYSLLKSILIDQNPENISKFRLFLFTVGRVIYNDQSLNWYIKEYKGNNVDWQLYNTIINKTGHDLFSDIIGN